MATPHRCHGMHLKMVLWLLLLVILISGFWHFMSPKPRTAWQMDKMTRLVNLRQTGKSLSRAKAGGPAQSVFGTLIREGCGLLLRTTGRTSARSHSLPMAVSWPRKRVINGSVPMEN